MNKQTSLPNILRSLLYGIFGLTFFIATISAINIVLLGNFSFWYDPARDLLQALGNLHKLTLIGPPSGIPGVFYGPYWIWLLSIGVKISKDPRIVTFLVATIPYVFLLPLLLWKFSAVFTKKIAFALWVLLAFTNFFSYATSLWNPYVSPILFLLLSYIMSHAYQEKKHSSTLAAFVLGGFLAGIISNFNLSFGLGVVGGTILFVIVVAGNETFKTKTIKSISWGIFTVSGTVFGILISYIPFFLFEYRHQFIQTKAFFHTITNSLFYDSAVVGQHGIQGLSLVRTFFGVFASLLQLPEIIIYPILLITIVYLLGLYKQKKHSVKSISFSDPSIALLFFLFSVFITILYLYFTTKNPIWSYHFIGIDMLYLLVIGLIAKQSKLLTTIFLTWTVCICLIHMPQMVLSLSQLGQKNTQVSSLAQKQDVIQKIEQDAQNNPYEVFVYNPAIYVYDYDYLLQWKTGKHAMYHPVALAALPKTVYVILPKAKKQILEDYIHYVTPPNQFNTQTIFFMGDGIQILKRIKISS